MCFIKKIIDNLFSFSNNREINIQYDSLLNSDINNTLIIEPQDNKSFYSQKEETKDKETKDKETKDKETKDKETKEEPQNKPIEYNIFSTSSLSEISSMTFTDGSDNDLDS